jgi:hypothetical protein
MPIVIAKYRLHKIIDRYKEQTNWCGYIIDSDESNFEQPSDEDEHDEVLSKEHHTVIENEKIEDKTNAASSSMQDKLKRMLADHDNTLK